MVVGTKQCKILGANKCLSMLDLSQEEVGHTPTKANTSLCVMYICTVTYKTANKASPLSRGADAERADSWYPASFALASGPCVHLVSAHPNQGIKWKQIICVLDPCSVSAAM